MKLIRRSVQKVKKVLYLLGRRSAVWLALGITAGVLAGASEVALGVTLQALLLALGLIQEGAPLIGGVLTSQLATPVFLLSTLLIVIGLKGACHFLIYQSSIVSQELINSRLRCVALNHLLNSKTFVSAGEINARIGDTFPKAAQFAQHVAIAIPNLIQCAVLISFMFWLAWKEALISLALILIIGMMVARANQSVRRIASLVPPEQKSLAEGIERIARNWLLVRVLRTAQSEGLKLYNNILNYSSLYIRAMFLANAASALPIVLGGVMLVVILSVNMIGTETHGATLLAFLYLLVRFTQQLAQLAKSYGAASSYFPRFKLAAQYFFSFRPEELELALHPSDSPRLYREQTQRLAKASQQASEKSKAPQIQIDNLSFRYGEDQPWIIENLSVGIPAGQQFGIVGASGAGKSTLLSLVLGVLEPSQGKILIDGQAPNDYFEKQSVRVGYVGAEAFLIQGSIRENLDYGSPGCFPDEQYWKALELAQLKSTIAEKPQGIEFRLKENGEGLSAGQKQRLALARAFLARPQVLILDEASANLDQQTEVEIAEAILKLSGEWTVLVVSHRPSILKGCVKLFHLPEQRLEVKSSPDQKLA